MVRQGSGEGELKVFLGGLIRSSLRLGHGKVWSVLLSLNLSFCHFYKGAPFFMCLKLIGRVCKWLCGGEQAAMW